MAKSGKKLDKKPEILEEETPPTTPGPFKEKTDEEPKKDLVLQIMRAKLSDLLTDQERDQLAETLDTPGYKVMHKISRLLQEDWGDQLISANYRNTPPEAIANFVVDAQGMKNGLISYFRMLNVYKKVIDKAEEKKHDKK